MFKVLQLRDMRIKEQKNLNENNLCLYKYITSYIKSTDISMYEKEEVLHQIMDMLLEAQYDNRDKAFIVGDDYKEFCKSIIDEYMIYKSKLYIALDYIQRYFIIMGIGLILSGIYNFFNIGQFSLTLDNILTWNVITLISLFLYKVLAREGIQQPISEGSNIKVNVSLGTDPKYLKSFVGIFILTLLVQLVIKEVFKIEPYLVKISLQGVVVTIIPVILLIIGGISIYKFDYNRRN